MTEHSSGIQCATHRVYLLSCGEYEAMWERCGGYCDACGNEIDRTKRDHAIDHDHRYGITAVRGIVCVRCNGYLAALESPPAPAVGVGYRRWFSGYFVRAWFLDTGRHHPPAGKHVDHVQLQEELRDWSLLSRYLFNRDPKAVLVPTDKPSQIVKVLREEMSPQAFARMVKMLTEEAATPKRMTPEPTSSPVDGPARGVRRG